MGGKMIICDGDCFNCTYPDCIGHPPEEAEKVKIASAKKHKRVVETRKKKEKEEMTVELNNFEKGFLFGMVAKEIESAGLDYERKHVLTSIYEKLKKGYIAEGDVSQAEGTT